jgi:adenylate cyclase
VRRQEKAAVLFADVMGGAGALGDCLTQLRDATQAACGEVVKTIGSEIMATFPGPDAAAAAASRMHVLMGALRDAGAAKLALRVGFQAGPVLRRDGDVFGDTVNVAARLAKQASPGQILTSRETTELMSPALRNCTRVLYSIDMKGKSSSVELCELLWQESPDITDVAGHESGPPMRLRVRYGGSEREAGDAGLIIGRDRDCDITVSDEHASRRHCTIQPRNGKFVVHDHSANGTYVTIEGEGEVALQREDYVLRGHGWIAFGQPLARTADTLEYFCD